VAFAQADRWQVSTIQGWTDDISRQYVGSAPPGVHTRAVEGPLRHNERRSLRCRSAAVIVGATESTGIAYCYIHSQWLYVWFSD
jgi:hypothetical protein